MEESLEAAHVAIRRLEAIEKAVGVMAALDTYFSTFIGTQAQEYAQTTYTLWRTLVQRIILDLGGEIAPDDLFIEVELENVPTVSSA